MCWKITKDTFHTLPLCRGKWKASSCLRHGALSAVSSVILSPFHLSQPPARFTSRICRPFTLHYSLHLILWPHTIVLFPCDDKNVLSAYRACLLLAVLQTPEWLISQKKKSHLRRLTFVPGVLTSPVSDPAIDLSQSTDLLALCFVRHSGSVRSSNCYLISDTS